VDIRWTRSTTSGPAGDGPADPGFRARIREELGDVLWYLSAVAHQLGLGLLDIATANLTKITDRLAHHACGPHPVRRRP
jgi:NTP pyrophosphatase (non-canonical NTP hydrolase)